MPLSTSQYGFIIDPMVPFTDASGTTIRNGYVRVFVAGSSTPVITYKNYDGATNEETIQLDNSGRTAYPVIVSKGNTYKVCVYDAEHSQESPILTIDKVVPAGANVEATNIVTGLDNVESPDAGWVKSTVSGTDAEVSLDATNVTSEVDTMVKATAASADYMMPLVHKTGSDPDKKITLGNIFKFVLNFIHSLTNTATEADLTSGNYFALDGSAGTKKLNSTTLLTKTAQNALSDNVAPAFDPTRDEDHKYLAGERVIYGGKRYVFTNDHYGAWDSSHVVAVSTLDVVWKKAYCETNGKRLSETSSSYIISTLIPVSVGQKVFFSGGCSSMAKPWATVNSNGYILRVCSDVNFSGVVEIEDGETSILLQSYITSFKDAVVCFENTLFVPVNVLKDEVFKFVGENGNYYNCSGTSVPSSKTAQSNYTSGIVYADAGDSFVYFGIGSSSAVSVATFDENLNFVRKLTGDYRNSALTFTIETGEVGFVWNGATGSVSLRRNSVTIADSISSILAKLSGQKKNDPDVKIDFIGTRKTLKLMCGKSFCLRCKIKYPKSLTKNPTSSLEIGSFDGVIPFMRSNSFAQSTSTYTDGGGNSVTSYDPWIKGGISPNGGTYNVSEYNMKCGELAFSVRYVGSGNSASISYDGTTITLNDSGTETQFAIADYSTMSSLYEAMAAVDGFEFGFVSLEGKTPEDLIVFGTLQLVSSYKRYASPDAETMTEFVDKPPIFISYADESWHNFEVVCNESDGKVYSSVDGIAYDWNKTRACAGETTFDFYGQKGFQFKDIFISTNSALDSEIVATPGANSILYSLSSFNPINAIFEGHGIVDGVGGSTRNLETSTDRMYSVFEMYKKKGYEPVSMLDIISAYNGGKPLPKRSMCICFDDYRFNDIINVDKRRPLIANAMKPVLAVITGRSETISYDGNVITMSQAIDIVRSIGGDLFTHTKEHTSLNKVKFSELTALIRAVISDADLKNIRSTMIVYPFGETGGSITFDIMRSLGLSAGLNVANGLNIPARNQYNLRRIEIGERVDWAYIESWCL